MKSINVETNAGALGSIFDSSLPEREVVNERTFRQMLVIERKRSERSKEPFLLMLAQSGGSPESPSVSEVLGKLTEVLVRSSRETDVVGWYKEQESVGVMFTSLLIKDRDLIRTTILNRVSAMLEGELTPEQFGQVGLSFHFFPDDWDSSDASRSSNAALYPDLKNPGKRKRGLLLIKRGIDVLFSALAVIAISPLLVSIALAVKLTSRGPVLLKQQRVGQYGRLFTALKFRSMVVNESSGVQQADMGSPAASGPAREIGGKADCVYGLIRRPRMTLVGRFLRQTSMDELPQIINVLLGDMSLVGPRPAIPYELAAYQTWHRRRILEAKPGITGLWQVAGQSLMNFDDMVRLDLRYASSWSLWLDLQILFHTPRAVFKGV